MRAASLAGTHSPGDGCTQRQARIVSGPAGGFLKGNDMTDKERLLRYAEIIGRLIAAGESLCNLAKEYADICLRNGDSATPREIGDKIVTFANAVRDWNREVEK